MDRGAAMGSKREHREDWREERKNDRRKSRMKRKSLWYGERREPEGREGARDKEGCKEVI